MKKSLLVLLLLAIGFSAPFAFNHKTTFIQGPTNGQKAPNLIYKNPTGNIMALSELKGKMVMIDFWASWCGPCRRANPFVVQMYNKYKDKKFNGGKGFEIFSVSLDQNAEAWKNAIAQDGLTWKYHVSDLGGWGSEGARIYGIQSIPQCVLVDGEGTIIGVGLRPEGVQQELESRLK
jgi:thiol-disulfide isomerase/thioredoxin